MKALAMLRCEKEASPETMPEGEVYPYVDQLRVAGEVSDDAVLAAVAERFDVTRQTARWWLRELGLL